MTAHENPFNASSSSPTGNPIEKLMSEFQQKCNRFKQRIKNMKTEELLKNESEREKEFMSGHLELLEIQALQVQINIYQKKMNDLRIQRKKDLELPLLDANNLSCEAANFQRDITLCKNYYSRHKEVDLPTVEEFEQRAPVSYSKVVKEINQLKQKSETMSEQIMNKEHELMMFRLKFELEEREKLEKEIEKLKQEQEKIKQEQNTLEKYIHNIPKNLQSIKKTVLQFEPHINPLKHKHSEWFANEEVDLVQKLPTPLFILYNKLTEYKHKCDDTVLLSISGDATEAAKEWETLEEEDTMLDHMNGVQEPKRKKAKVAELNDDNCKLFPLIIQLRIHLNVDSK